MFNFLTKAKLITLSVTSFMLFILSLILVFVVVPLVIDSEIDKNIQLVRGTDQWHRFKQLPFNLTFNVTLFEVTNAEGVINNKEKPILKEKGPYVFDEIIKKRDLIYNDDDDSVSYERNTTFYFNQSRSGPDVTYDDVITIINPVYLAIMQMAKDFPFPLFLVAGPIQACMNSMFEDGLLLRVSVRNILFDGIRICDFNNKACSFLSISLCKNFEGKTKLIERIETADEKYLKFSFLNFKARESDGTYNVKTGITDISDVGRIVTWNGTSYSHFWAEDRMKNSCNIIEGTDATIFPPHLTEETKLSVFSTDICRSVEILYDGVDTYRDIEGYLFRTKPSLLYSTCVNPYDDCFCVQKILDTEGQKSCFLDGVMDLYPCLGVPVLLSYPHLLYADKKYLENLEGDIAPDVNKHSLYVLLDKYSSIPLQAHKRVQINMIIRKCEGFEKLTSQFIPTILPLFWIDEGIELPDSGIDLLNSLLYDTINLVNILQWVFVGITLGLTILFCSFLGYGYCKGFNK